MGTPVAASVDALRRADAQHSLMARNPDARLEARAKVLQQLRRAVDHRGSIANHTLPLRDTVQQGQRTPRIGLIDLAEEALQDDDSTAHERRGAL
jgi:hypothetical protein